MKSIAGVSVVVVMLVAGQAMAAFYDFEDSTDANDFTFVCQGGAGSPSGWYSDIGVGGTGGIMTSLADGSGYYKIIYDIPFDVADYTVIEFDVKDMYAGGALLWRFDYPTASPLAYLKKRGGWAYAADGGTAGVYRTPGWNNEDWNHMKFEIDNGITNIWINDNPAASIENFDWSYSMDDATIFDMGYHNFVHPGVYVDNFSFTSIPEPATMVLLTTGLVGLIARRRG